MCGSFLLTLSSTSRSLLSATRQTGCTSVGADHVFEKPTTRTVRCMNQAQNGYHMAPATEKSFVDLQTKNALEQRTNKLPDGAAPMIQANPSALPPHLPPPRHHRHTIPNAQSPSLGPSAGPWLSAILVPLKPFSVCAVKRSRGSECCAWRWTAAEFKQREQR